MNAGALTTSIRPGSLRAWLLATRPATLFVSSTSVLVGIAVVRHQLLAQGQSHGMPVVPLLAALLGAVFLQIGANFANDFLDHEKGADTAARIGPIRATQAGLLTAAQLRGGMVASFVLATVAGLVLVRVAGASVIAIGIASMIVAFAYTGGPFPLGYNGLGDVFVFVFFGPVGVMGTVFVALGETPPLALAASLPVGAISTAVLVVNNLRDRTTDAEAGKRTVIVRFGRRFGVTEYVCLLALAYLVPVVLTATGAASPFALLPLLTLPIAIALVRKVTSAEDGPTYNACLARTAQLVLLHGVLFASGLAVQ